MEKFSLFRDLVSWAEEHELKEEEEEAKSKANEKKKNLFSRISFWLFFFLTANDIFFFVKWKTVSS